MEPKEKAKELIEKMNAVTYGGMAKKCALIAVDDEIALCESILVKVSVTNADAGDIISDEISELQQVKEELLKM